jgi:hypothetical protein
MTDCSVVWFYDEVTIDTELRRRTEIMVARAMVYRFSNDDSAFLAEPSAPIEGLSDEFARALDLAFWTLDFRGDLEDALDVAFLRTALAATPTLSGGLLSSAA